jgi:tetratricopeptide (TPR) repeat protein
MTDRVDGQIAHIDRDNRNPELDNLVFLCLRHHDEYDSIPRQTKRLSPDEVRFYQKQLHQVLGTIPVSWELRIEGEKEDFDNPRVQKILAELQKIAKSSTVTLRSVERGSVILKLESSKNAFEEILKAYQSGVLAETLNLEILSLRPASTIDADSMHALGEELLDKLDFENAIRCYNRVIEAEPSNAIAWAVKASALYSQSRIEANIDSENGYLDHAFACACRAMELDSSSAAVIANFGVIRFSRGERTEGLQDIERAIKINPKFAFAWFNKGAMQYSMGLHSESIKSLEVAAELGSEDALLVLSEAKVRKWKPR